MNLRGASAEAIFAKSSFRLRESQSVSASSLKFRAKQTLNSEPSTLAPSALKELRPAPRRIAQHLLVGST
eukprot:4686118-Prymnesium_polylepis.1